MLQEGSQHCWNGCRSAAGGNHAKRNCLLQTVAGFDTIYGSTPDGNEGYCYDKPFKVSKPVIN
jgi:hypothetical protein